METLPLFITKEDVAKLLDVAHGVHVTHFDTFIREAQLFDLKPILCEDFYYDVLYNKNTEPYATLLNGGNYIYNGRTYTFLGLKAVLAYFTYARFIMKSSNTSTSYGNVTKINPFSEPMSQQEKRNLYYNYQKEANMIYQDVVKYLDRNSILFPSYACRCGKSNTRPFKTTVL